MHPTLLHTLRVGTRSTCNTTCNTYGSTHVETVVCTLIPYVCRDIGYWACVLMCIRIPRYLDIEVPRMLTLKGHRHVMHVSQHTQSVGHHIAHVLCPLQLVVVCIHVYIHTSTAVGVPNMLCRGPRYGISWVPTLLTLKGHFLGRTIGPNDQHYGPNM